VDFHARTPAGQRDRKGVSGYLLLLASVRITVTVTVSYENR
jgi:hypothetical protein